MAGAVVIVPTVTCARLCIGDGGRRLYVRTQWLDDGFAVTALEFPRSWSCKGVVCKQPTPHQISCPLREDNCNVLIGYVLWWHNVPVGFCELFHLLMWPWIWGGMCIVSRATQPSGRTVMVIGVDGCWWCYWWLWCFGVVNCDQRPRRMWKRVRPDGTCRYITIFGSCTSISVPNTLKPPTHSPSLNMTKRGYGTCNSDAQVGGIARSNNL